jgi:RHS repeat-associated protein
MIWSVAGENKTKEFLYDKNANLIKDYNKSITEISYNVLNLPQTLKISSATNTYTYAADGRKLKTVLGGSKITDYCGNVIYENGLLKRILVDGGYIENGTYSFYLTDHLGNNRVIASSSGSIVQSNHYYPFGMSFAEGSATSQQPYKYNGKELDTERGLNLYDYSARYMDPALGRFSTVDPMAEKYYDSSPYAYTAITL